MSACSLFCRASLLSFWPVAQASPVGSCTPTRDNGVPVAHLRPCRFPSIPVVTEDMGNIRHELGYRGFGAAAFAVAATVVACALRSSHGHLPPALAFALFAGLVLVAE